MTNPQKLKELQVFFDLISDLACIFPPEGTFQMLNPVWKQVTGWTLEALQSSSWIEFVHPDDVAVTQERIDTLLNHTISSSIVFFESRWLYRDGSYRRLVWRVSLGEGGLLYAIAREISPSNPELQQLHIEVKQAQEAWFRSEEHFSKAFRANPVPACITTWQEGQLLDVNNSFLRISGYCREEVTGRTALEVGLWANIEARPKVFQMLQEQKSGSNMEVQYRTKSGEIRHGVASFEVVEFNGETCILSQTYDITKYKQVEETIKASLQEKEILLQEIHHRVKNNLQIISSLLDLQSQYAEEPVTQAMFQESRNRVKSMAIVHETLYQSSNFAEIDFAEYIDNLTSSLFQAYGVNTNQITLKKKLDGVTLNLDIAIPCGLIINELVSNALKYAFPNEMKGKIDISFHYNEDKDYILIVKDDGIGLPTNFHLKHLNSLGLNLVKVLIEQLEGTLELDCHEGTEFCLRFPQPV